MMDLKTLLAPFRGQPWLGWLMVCLARQVERQRWLKSVYEKHLQGVEEWEGDVPSLPGWSFEFHGTGLCLRGPGGEAIDHDIHSRGIRQVDPYFFAWRIEGLQNAALPEAKLQQWLPGTDLLVVCLDQLKKGGFLVGEHCVTLPKTWDSVGVIERFDQVEEWLGEGDRAAYLVALVADREQARRCLEDVLALLQPDAARTLCYQTIDGPVDHASARAVAGLTRLDFPDDTSASRSAPPAEATERILALRVRLDPECHHPYIACKVARYLFLAGHHEEGVDLVQRFAAMEKVQGYNANPMLDQLTFLLLEWAPELAPPLVRRALGQGSREVAALLSLLDRPWCHRELIAALERPDLEQTSRRYLAAALVRSADLQVRRRALLLAPPPAVPEEDSIGYTYDEVVAHNLLSLMGHTLKDLRPLADRLGSPDL